MFESVALCVLFWAGYKGFMAYLAYKERQQSLPPPGVWQVVDESPPRACEPASIQVCEAAVASPMPVPPKGMNKWLFLLLAFLYVVSPIDLLPDFIPLVGQADDVAAIVMTIQKFMRG